MPYLRRGSDILFPLNGMDTRIFNFQDDRLTPEAAPACSLYVIAGTDGFSMLVQNGGGETLALEAWHFAKPGRTFQDAEADIRIVFGQTAYLAFPYEKVVCAYANPNVTLTPRRLFDREQLDVYFKLLVRPADYSYGFEPLPEFDCLLVYAVEESLQNICRPYFPNGRSIHLAAPLIRAFCKLHARIDYEVMVNLRNQVAQVLVFDRQNLLFYNTFHFEQPGDLLYSVLLAYDQFRLNPLETPLTLAGNVTEDSEIYRMIYRYVRHIGFAPQSYTGQLPAAAVMLPPHCFFDLFTLPHIQ